VNAAESLPADVLDAIYEAVGEKPCYMWVPARQSINRRERDQYAVQLHEEGYAAADIAVRLFISERTVWRILARERARRASSDRVSSGIQQGFTPRT